MLNTTEEDDDDDDDGNIIHTESSEIMFSKVVYIIHAHLFMLERK